MSEFQIPEVSDVDMVLPCRYRELLPKFDDLSKEERSMRSPQCQAISTLFFRGGKLADILAENGLRFCDGVDRVKVGRYLRATLGDLGPSHEHKIGGIGHMLAKWTEPGKQVAEAKANKRRGSAKRA